MAAIALSISGPALEGRRTFHENGKTHANLYIESIEKAAAHLFTPISMATRDAICLSRKWNPEHPLQEIVHRVRLAVTCILLLGLGIVPLIIGQVLLLLTMLARKDFTFVQPEEIENGGSPNELKVVTYNICGGPPWMADFNGVDPIHERIGTLAETIGSFKVDVVCLQEMFDERVAETLRLQLLQQGFEFAVYNVAPHPWKLNSGLFIASKYPLQQPIFWNHTQSRGLDSFAEKGTLGVTVQAGNRKIALFNTHFNASENTIQSLQMEGFLDHIEYYTKETHLENRVVACGDFNAEYLNDLSNRFQDLLLDSLPEGGERTLVPPDHFQPGCKKEASSSFAGPAMIIDHMAISRDTAGWGLKTSEILVEKGSDHLPVRATFHFIKERLRSR